eukprot:Blabericola_migrator_1__2950@NODE_184_length_11839_cov_88_277438_g159_i0_p1_GENE_NODE_184_length_11839_cov_88_277438_g159_i0NODE_184_length_11839_cov_88_277438_g159_i0_p1_ORF_typecomplete_len1106_score206_42Med5/PF08689_10/2_8e03Med5/PF08689_10/0_017Med5/PF08689_10/7_8e02CDC14/PF08045_11/0_55_NODE_184_length_11839_cov_88_277438_g159_i055668883
MTFAETLKLEGLLRLIEQRGDDVNSFYVLEKVLRHLQHSKEKLEDDRELHLFVSRHLQRCTGKETLVLATQFAKVVSTMLSHSPVLLETLIGQLMPMEPNVEVAKFMLMVLDECRASSCWTVFVKHLPLEGSSDLWSLLLKHPELLKLLIEDFNGVGFLSEEARERLASFMVTSVGVKKREAAVLKIASELWNLNGRLALGRYLMKAARTADSDVGQEEIRNRLLEALIIEDESVLQRGDVIPKLEVVEWNLMVWIEICRGGASQLKADSKAQRYLQLLTTQAVDLTPNSSQSVLDCLVTASTILMELSPMAVKLSSLVARTQELCCQYHPETAIRFWAARLQFAQNLNDLRGFWLTFLETIRSVPLESLDLSFLKADMVQDQLISTCDHSVTAANIRKHLQPLSDIIEYVKTLPTSAANNIVYVWHTLVTCIDRCVRHDATLCQDLVSALRQVIKHHTESAKFHSVLSNSAKELMTGRLLPFLLRVSQECLSRCTRTIHVPVIEQQGKAQMTLDFNVNLGDAVPASRKCLEETEGPLEAWLTGSAALAQARDTSLLMKSREVAALIPRQKLNTLPPAVWAAADISLSDSKVLKTNFFDILREKTSHKRHCDILSRLENEVKRSKVEKAVVKFVDSLVSDDAKHESDRNILESALCMLQGVRFLARYAAGASDDISRIEKLLELLMQMKPLPEPQLRSDLLSLLERLSQEITGTIPPSTSEILLKFLAQRAFDLVVWLCPSNEVQRAKEVLNSLIASCCSNLDKIITSILQKWCALIDEWEAATAELTTELEPGITALEIMAYIVMQSTQCEKESSVGALRQIFLPLGFQTNPESSSLSALREGLADGNCICDAQTVVDKRAMRRMARERGTELRNIILAAERRLSKETEDFVDQFAPGKDSSYIRKVGQSLEYAVEVLTGWKYALGKSHIVFKDMLESAQALILSVYAALGVLNRVVKFHPKETDVVGVLGAHFVALLANYQTVDDHLQQHYLTYIVCGHSHIINHTCKRIVAIFPQHVSARAAYTMSRRLFEFSISLRHMYQEPLMRFCDAQPLRTSVTSLKSLHSVQLELGTSFDALMKARALEMIKEECKPFADGPDCIFT